MSELVDLVNEDGELILSAVPRKEAETHPKLYMPIVIAVISNSEGEVLVEKRAAHKWEGGKIDLICGAMVSGEPPEQAALRETQEEAGLTPENLKVVRTGINPYNFYCYLLSGRSDQTPPPPNNNQEVDWAEFHKLDFLNAQAESGTWQFVDGFFEDIAAAREI